MAILHPVHNLIVTRNLWQILLTNLHQKLLHHATETGRWIIPI